MDINVNPKRERNINEEIELLNNMGYDRIMINKIYLLLKPKNIEQAINYMTQINGLYQHTFIQNTFPEHLCYICLKPRQNHFDYIPNDLILNVENNNNISNEEKETDIKYDSNIDQDILSNESPELCGVCYEKINQEDKLFNILPCGHLFCSNCWFDYFKTLISEAKTNKIKCMESKCTEYISEEFILKHISKDFNLEQKYIKFKKRYEIIKDKNKKICPNVNCDSFLQKSEITKYVECENGHKYCFECLTPPHGEKKCSNKNEEKFLKWKKGKRVKRCPYCQMYIEKNEGCNHMTCTYCNYEWCWICEQKYDIDHFSSGTCEGHSETQVDSLKELKDLQNRFGIHKIFRCVYAPLIGPLDFGDHIKAKYICMVIFYFFAVFLNFAFVSLTHFSKGEPNLLEKIKDRKIRRYTLIFGSLGIGLCLLLIFQFTFMCLLTPFMIISFIYHPFFGQLLMFLGIGNHKYFR